MTGENLLQLLESRLDTVVHRMGFAASVPNHGRSCVTIACWSMVVALTFPHFRFARATSLGIAERARVACESKRRSLLLNRVDSRWVEVNVKEAKGNLQGASGTQRTAAVDQRRPRDRIVFEVMAASHD